MCEGSSPGYFPAVARLTDLMDSHISIVIKWGQRESSQFPERG